MGAGRGLDTLRARRAPCEASQSFSVFSLSLNLAEELLEVLGLRGEVRHLRLSLLVVYFAAGVASLVDRVQLASQLDYFVCLLLLLSFELSNTLVKLRHAMLGLQLLAHGERYGTRHKIQNQINCKQDEPWSTIISTYLW